MFSCTQSNCWWHIRLNLCQGDPLQVRLSWFVAKLCLDVCNNHTAPNHSSMLNKICTMLLCPHLRLTSSVQYASTTTATAEHVPVIRGPPASCTSLPVAACQYGSGWWAA